MSDSIGALVGLPIVVYASTNIDDLLVLAVFFADPRVHVTAVVAGRFIGLAALLLVSGAVALLALVIPEEWIALLGLVPLLLGLRLLPALVRGSDDADSDATAGISGANDPKRGFASQAWSVAGVTLANGGDNLSVYIPLFASAPHAIASYVIVFSVMTIVWCVLGYVTVNNPLIGNQIRRYGHVLLPIVLILLGLYILSGAIALFR